MRCSNCIIEQGPILEAEGKDIASVTHGQGLRWIQCTVTGKESHTGSTPECRCAGTPGRGLAQITELVHQIAMDNAPNAVGAIGHVDVYPNSRNIIPPARRSSPSISAATRSIRSMAWSSG